MLPTLHLPKLINKHLPAHHWRQKKLQRVSQNDTPIWSTQKLMRRRGGGLQIEGPFRQEIVSGKKSMDGQTGNHTGKHRSAEAQRTWRNSWALGMTLFAVKFPRT